MPITINCYLTDYRETCNLVNGRFLLVTGTIEFSQFELVEAKKEERGVRKLNLQLRLTRLFILGNL